MENRKRVVIIGAGFGGLFAARNFANQPIEVLLIDRNNYHTFTPLLYQVATSALDPSEIAYPIRSIFHSSDNIHCLMGEVTEIDTQSKNVVVEMEGNKRSENYDYLIIATGSVPAYFGNEDFKKHAFELNTLDDAVALRNHILRLFEQAAWTDDDQLREALTTLVVVGGGPTGLETGGALYELYNHVLDREFSPDKRMQARVLLVELLPHLLAGYPAKLRQAALQQLESLGVEVLLGNPVTLLAEDHIQLADGRIIPTHTVIWTAGVEASPAAEFLGQSILGIILENRRGARVDDWGGLENRCGPCGPPWVRIPPSPLKESANEREWTRIARIYANYFLMGNSWGQQSSYGGRQARIPAPSDMILQLFAGRLSYSSDVIIPNNMEKGEIIERARSVLFSTPDVSLAYLFGSKVNDTSGPISDIDLAILFEVEGDVLDRRTELAYELGKGLQFHRIDIVSLHEASVELAYAIISQGICIYQRDNATRVEFEAQILSRYGDYLPILRAQRQEILGEKGDDHRIQRYREALRRTERTLSEIRTA